MTDFEQLKQVLGAQLNTFKELLELEKNKTEVLKSGKISELDKIVNSEQAFIMKLAQLETKQSFIISEYFPAEYNISQIIAYCIIDEKEDFQLINEEIDNVLLLIQQVNKVNKAMLKNSIDMISFISDRIGSGNLDNQQIVDIMADFSNRDKNDDQYLLNKKI